MKLIITKVWFGQKYYDDMNIWSCYHYDAHTSEKREVCSYSGILVDGKKEDFERKFKHIPQEKLRFEYIELIPEMIKSEWIILLYEMKKNQTLSYNSFVAMPTSLLKMYEEVGNEKNLLTNDDFKDYINDMNDYADSFINSDTTKY